MANIVAQKIFRSILDLITWLIGLLYPPKKGSDYLPPITDPILLEPAINIVAKIKSGELKCHDYMKALISRLEEVEPFINSLTDNRFELALKEAKELDTKIEKELNGPSKPNSKLLSLPLLGLPFTGKETMPIKGLSLTAGSVSRKGEKALKDCQVVLNLKEAGAIPIATTNIPELAWWWDTNNCLYGRTNNPYDLNRTCGGSSGGQGACIAAAGSVVGFGSDIGGSIRVPSNFCGIFGHKTTSKVVDTSGHFPFISESRQRFLTFGPMCRYAADLKPTLVAMAGKNISKLPKINDAVELSNIKIYYMDDIGSPVISPVDQNIKDGIFKVLKHMSLKHNCLIKRENLSKFKDSNDIFANTVYTAPDVPLALLMGDNKKEVNLVEEVFRKLVGMSNHTLEMIFAATRDKIPVKSSDPECMKYITEGQTLKEELFSLIGDDGVFLFPTHPVVALKHNTTIYNAFNVAYTAIFNVLGMPVTQCPLGLTPDGLPIGVQVIAKPYNDHLTIAVAEEIERAFGGWKSPSKVQTK